MADAPASLTHYLETIFANCAGDTVCRTAYPDLANVFAQLIDRARHDPIVFTNADPVTHDSFTTTIDSTALIGWLVYTDPRAVPGVIYDLRDGDPSAIAQLQHAMLREARRPQWPLSEGMKTSVLCQLRLAQVTNRQIATSNARFAAGPWANEIGRAHV